MPTRRNQHLQRHSRAPASEVETLRSELRAEKLAREAVERENRDLRTEVARLNEKLEEVLLAQRRMEEFLQAHIRRLEKDVADRDATIDDLNKQLTWFRKKVFDSTSEQSVLPEATNDEPDEEPAAEPPPKRKRGQQRGSKGHGRSDRSDLPTDEQVLTRDCACQTCGKAYRAINRTERSPLIDLHTIITLTNFLRQIYVPDCQCPGGKPVTAEPPPKLYKRTLFGNTVWLHLVVQKFLFGMPTNRTLKELSLKGLRASQGTITGGFKRIDVFVEPLYDSIVEHCRGGSLWSSDETSWRVFDAGGKKWWYWLIASEDAVVYILDQSRSKSVPEQFFAGSVGTIMTDRLASYKGLHDGIKKSLCWVHVRRDFLKIFQGIKKLKIWSQQWLELIARLFVLAEIRFRIWETGGAFGSKWLAASSDLIDHVQAMEAAWQQQLSQSNLHAQQKKVLLSLKRHWVGLTIFVGDPRVPLHNNRAERLLRNPVVLRKNSYGSGSVWAGKFGAKMFSILQTWLLNGLDAEALLLDYFNEVSKAGRAPPDLDRFLPWKMSESRRRDFALPVSYKRPG